MYVVRDNRLDMPVTEPKSRFLAGLDATRLSIEAGRRGEPVDTPSGLDRFTVTKAP